MSGYTKKINELDKRVEVLAVQLKKMREWCQEAIKKLEAIQVEQKQLKDRK